MCLPKNKVKARHHYKVQGSGLIILQFAALVTHDLAVHAEHVRSKHGACAEQTRTVAEKDKPPWPEPR